MYVVNGSDGRCLGAVRLIVGVRYLERPLREVLLYQESQICTISYCARFARETTVFTRLSAAPD